MDDTTFCTWCPAGAQAWCKGAIEYPSASDPDGSSWLLSCYKGEPATYLDFAQRYDEIDIPVEAIARVYRHEPLSSALIEGLRSQRRFDQRVVEAAAIGYPTV